MRRRVCSAMEGVVVLLKNKCFTKKLLIIHWTKCKQLYITKGYCNLFYKMGLFFSDISKWEKIVLNIK